MRKKPPDQLIGHPVKYNKRTDPTYIAQLIGRMVRTPLARCVETVEELNTVACYLPEFDADTVDSVVERLKADNVAVDDKKILKNPADVSFFGQTKQNLERKLAMKQSSAAQQNEAESSTHTVSTVEGTSSAPSSDSDDYSVVTDEFSVDIGDEIPETEQELKEALERIPKVDADEVKSCFEAIVTRQVRHDKPDHFLDLWECVDIILSDLDEDSDVGTVLQNEFYNHIEGEIVKHPAEFKRAVSDIKNTTVTVKRIDPLSGEIFEDREEVVENDSVRLTAYYKHAVSVFAGNSDIIKYYINRWMKEHYETDTRAIGRIAAVGYCIEIVQAMELWAADKTEYLLSIYGPQRYNVLEDNKAKWDRIEGNTKPYIERNLNIQASITRQNKEYDRYPMHIISDEYGWAYLNLNPIEKKVVETELAKSVTVAWYRNQARNLNASLSIPYELNGENIPMYPDFIFFVKTGNGIARSIVDPHGDWLGDSIAKLKGYVEYIKDHPDMFVSVLAVTDEVGGEYRYLDLMMKPVQAAIENFTGTSAKELFTGHLSKKYQV